MATVTGFTVTIGNELIVTMTFPVIMFEQLFAPTIPLTVYVPATV